jgi:hypothetical protein
MKRSMKFRPVPNQIEAITKRHNWSSLAIVGISDAEVLQRMLFACTRLALTVVATWPEKSNRPGERIKQVERANRVRKLARSYASRVTLLECTAGEAAHKLCGQEFDGAALFDVADLESDGGAWAALVRSGGMLLGTDHRDIETRAVLNAVAPGWERLDDGLWCVRVKREAALKLGPLDSPSGTLVEQSLDGGDVVHDPVNSGPGVDEVVHDTAPVVAGAEGLGADEADGLAGHAHVPKGAGKDRGESRVGRAKVNVDRPKARTPKLALPSEISGSDVHAVTIAPKKRGRPAKKKVEV